MNQKSSLREVPQMVSGVLTANKLSEMSPVALKRGKYAIAAMENMAFPEALAFAESLIAVASRTADAQEGLAAFNERRKPNWVEGKLDERT